MRPAKIAVLIGATGAIRQTQSAEPTKDGPKKKRVKKASTSQGDPPKVGDKREYSFISRLVEAGADEPKVILDLPKITVDEGQLAPLHLIDNPQNLLENVVLDEKIKIGISLDMRVKRLEGNQVRLFLSFQKNELEKSSVSEIRVLGNSLQTVQVVELRKPVKIVLQKDARGSAQRWVEITVDEQVIPAPPATAVPVAPSKAPRGQA